jgi:micrococcal nuclease
VPRLPTILALATLSVLAGCSGAAPGATEVPAGATAAGGDVAFRGSVVEVIDGDTVKVEYSNGTLETVRLLGVDAPETRGSNRPGEFEGVPDTERGRACLDAAAGNATTFVTRRLLGERAAVVVDPAADRRDRYGRLLAYLRIDGTNLNYRLVAAGHARVYDARFSLSDRFYEAERRAQRNGTGLWACAAGGRVGTASAALAVASIHADAAGDDRENLDDEYVVFLNEGEGTLSLSGWIVSDAAGATYTVPEGTELAPGERLTLHTGSGTDGDGVYYWDASRPVWNNGGDTITVVDDDGDLVLQRSY